MGKVGGGGGPGGRKGIEKWPDSLCEHKLNNRCHHQGHLLFKVIWACEDLEKKSKNLWGNRSIFPKIGNGILQRM